LVAAHRIGRVDWLIVHHVNRWVRSRRLPSYRNVLETGSDDHAHREVGIRHLFTNSFQFERKRDVIPLSRRVAYLVRSLKLTVDHHHSMHRSAMQYYGRLRFPMGTCDFLPPPRRNPLTDRYEILHNNMSAGSRDVPKMITIGLVGSAPHIREIYSY
jgi:hypothetical protein